MLASPASDPALQIWKSSWNPEPIPQCNAAPCRRRQCQSSRLQRPRPCHVPPLGPACSPRPRFLLGNKPGFASRFQGGAHHGAASAGWTLHDMQVHISFALWLGPTTFSCLYNDIFTAPMSSCWRAIQVDESESGMLVCLPTSWTPTNTPHHKKSPRISRQIRPMGHARRPRPRSMAQSPSCRTPGPQATLRPTRNLHHFNQSRAVQLIASSRNQPSDGLSRWRPLRASSRPCPPTSTFPP